MSVACCQAARLSSGSSSAAAAASVDAGELEAPAIGRLEFGCTNLHCMQVCLCKLCVYFSTPVFVHLCFEHSVGTMLSPY